MYPFHRYTHRPPHGDGVDEVLVVLLVVELVVVDDELLELVVVDDELDELVVVVEPPSSWQNVYPTWFISVPLYAGGPEHSQPTPHSSETNTQVDPFHTYTHGKSLHAIIHPRQSR